MIIFNEKYLTVVIYEIILVERSDVKHRCGKLLGGQDLFSVLPKFFISRIIHRQLFILT